MRSALHGWVLRSTAARPDDRAPKISESAHSGPLTILLPADGDTLRYAESKEVTVRWTGIAGSPYRIEYDVGEGAYDLDGSLDASGGVSRHGPFTEEMWNMLALYNPFTFRVVGPMGQTSAWVSFRIAATREGAPSWTSRIATAATLGWGEARILAEGLGLATVELGRIVGRIPVADALGYGLIIALAASLVSPLLRGVDPERLRAWAAVAGYTMFIYATLGVMPEVWGALTRYTQGRIDYGGSLAVLIGAATVIAMTLRRGAGWRSYAALVPLSGAYAYLLTELNTLPAERFHLAEYGVLSLFAFRALSVDKGLAASCLIGWGIASAAGTVDEAIQWILPNRVFEWKDVGLNALSSALAMGIIAVVATSGNRENA